MSLPLDSDKETPVSSALLDYEREKWAWVDQNPDATPQEFEAFIKDLVKRLGI